MQFSLLTLLWARSVVDNEVYQGKFRFLEHIWQSYPWPPVTSARDPELAERVLAGKGNVQIHHGAHSCHSSIANDPYNLRESKSDYCARVSPVET